MTYRKIVFICYSNVLCMFVNRITTRHLVIIHLFAVHTNKEIHSCMQKGNIYSKKLYFKCHLKIFLSGDHCVIKIYYDLNSGTV